MVLAAIKRLLLNHSYMLAIMGHSEADLCYSVNYSTLFYRQSNWSMHYHGYNSLIGRLQGLDSLTFQYHCRPTLTGGNQCSRRKSAVSVYLSHIL